MVDVTTLEKLAAQIREDMAGSVGGLNRSTCLNVASIIEKAIGAPIAWPSREAGAHFADTYYRGSNSTRAAFNHGVKWAVERYSPTELIKNREHT